MNSYLCQILGQELLGKGQFGSVWKGVMKNQRNDDLIVVAIKTVLHQNSYDTESEELHRRLFIEELKVMTKVGRHLNIVNLLGTVTIGSCILFVVIKKQIHYVYSFHVYRKANDGAGVLCPGVSAKLLTSTTQ